MKNLKKKIGDLCKRVCQKTKTRRFKFFVIVGIILALIILFVRFFLIAAVVNGLPITRISLIRELERQGGKSILDSLVEKSLVFQEANRLKVTVSNDELNTEIKNIEDYVKNQGITLDEALSVRGQTKADLIEQIKLQKLVEKILGGKISITDDEIKTYFNENINLFDKGAKLETVKDQIKEQLFQTKLSEEYNTWVAELKTKAHILYFVNY